MSHALFPPYSAIALPQSDDLTINPPVYGSSPVFDFDTGDFKISASGSLLLKSGKEALAEWIRKTLVTPRFVYGIYPTWYGSEVLGKIGGAKHKNPLSKDSLSVIGDVERGIKDALKVDRRVIDVIDFASTFDADHMVTSFTVLSSLGPIPNLTAITGF